MKKKGFTVIEILIIVAIIAILASVILVTLGTARDRAKDNSFKTTARSIQDGLAACCTDFNADLPDSGPNGSICLNGAKYPDSNSMGSVNGGTVKCSSSGYFLKIVTPGAKNKGNCTEADIDNENITYTGC